MFSSSKKITNIKAREVLDSRGYPTLEVEVGAGSLTERAFIPSGASKGKHEAYELRDEDPSRFKGKGVLKACQNVELLSQHLKGQSLEDLEAIDQKMIDLDGTENKSKLGANAILGVSLACARLRAHSLKQPLYQIFGGKQFSMPIPLINVLNGGAHASNNIDIQEFMLVPHGFSSFRRALQASAEVFHTLRADLKAQGQSISLGDEGGVAPNLKSNEEALQYLIRSIEKAGYKPQEEISLALDVAASSFYKNGSYQFEGESIAASDLVSIYDSWLNKYPLVSIEDGLEEDQWDEWKQWTALHNKKVQIVGDDLFVTHCKKLQRGISENIANAILIKINQIGTISEAHNTVKLAHSNSYTTVLSHRSGETEDTSIADLSLAFNCEQIKTGGMSRGERICKYNRLLKIEEELGSSCTYDASSFLNRYRS